MVFLSESFKETGICFDKDFKKRSL